MQGGDWGACFTLLRGAPLDAMRKVNIPSIEVEIGVFLLLNPAHYRDLEELFVYYKPVSPLLASLLDAFKRASEEGTPHFVDKYLSVAEKQFWLEATARFSHLQVGDLSMLPKIRKYLETEGRKQEVIRSAAALSDALQRGAPIDTVKEYLLQLQLMVFREERALDLKDIIDLLHKLRDAAERPKTHPFPFLKEIFGFPVHIVNNDITVVMGRTGRGKTTLSLNLAKSYIQENKVVCYVSTEMDERAIATKFASIVAGVPWSQLWGQDFSEEAANMAISVLRGLYEISEGGLFVYHAPACTVSDVAYAISLTRANYGRVDAVFVDYIQQLGTTVNKASDETRAAELARIIRELADIITEHRAAGIIVSQVNAAGEVKDSRAIAERAALLVRLGMLSYDDFEKYALYLLHKPKGTVIPAHKRAALRSLYRNLVDVEVVKNRYGSHSAGQLGFIEWNPETGQFNRPVTVNELKDRLLEILSDVSDVEELQPRKGKSRRRADANDFDLPSFTPTLNQEEADEDDEIEFPF